MNARAFAPPEAPAEGAVEFSETVEIAADAARVWRALTDPSEVVLWDTGVVRPLEIARDYPQPGQATRWRYELGPLRLTLRDFPVEVVEQRTFRSLIRLGPFCFDETYSLHEVAREGGVAGTRLTAKLVLWSEVSLLGGLLTRWIGRPTAASVVRHSLEAIRAHCEARN
ncbi:MAG: SRPBCC family protein [Deltaproteobacteria bacterium]|nr:SRPBCC family protein [Deltaproteobacteria bacterium]MBW2392726.1 SRPBCC family protein [Deltaproteobacteria bacterium]